MALALAVSAAVQGADVGPNALQPDTRQSLPAVAPASSEGEQAIRRFRIPPGYKVELFAAEPMLANPVAFAIDESGRIFTSETYRYRSSVLDIRHYMSWLEDDLASRNNTDRLAMLKKYLGQKVNEMGLETEVIRQIEDTDGDGKADKSTVFADGFNDVLDGIASGVMARKGDVFFTNIPKLWKLRDQNGDGKSDTRQSLADGFGVHYNFTGHDLHGLILGPDGRLYFSIGDRGSHVVNKEGKTLDYPDEGAVFRCNLDGSDLELFARGLRNPQELAFDQYGNLFTGDNDSDQGDRERWVYVVEGSDSGWRIGYQHNPLGNAGPWNFEKLWWPLHEGQPAYIIPPVVNIDNGPSGLVYNYGTGLPRELDNHFFLCHFKGASANSRITSYLLKPKGAGFEMDRTTEFLGDVLPTDVEIGPDGSMYFSDWHQGWPKSSKGRIYKVTHPIAQQDPTVLETRRIIGQGMTKRSPEELQSLLGHRDMRVRNEAQFELVDRGPIGSEKLLAAARTGEPLLARLHGIWGLGQLARKASTSTATLSSLLRDPHSEVRAQTAKVLGEARAKDAFRPLSRALQDPQERVRFFAAVALAKLGDRKAVQPILEMLRRNGDSDVYVRHAGVIALASLAQSNELINAAQDKSPSVRLAALLAMRRQQTPEISIFLKDPDKALVLEAARAINDAPINEALPGLAELSDGRVDTLSLGYRVVNANYRLGTATAATRLATYATRTDVPAETRIEALRGLAQWAKPFPRDRVVGTFRPLPDRSPAPAAQALEVQLARLLKQNHEGVLIAAAQASVKLGLKQAFKPLSDLFTNRNAPPKARVEALHSLAELAAPSLAENLAKAFDDEEELVRREATRLQARTQSPDALNNLKKVLAKGSASEKQDALLALSDLTDPSVDELVLNYLDSLANNSASPEIRLDILDVAAKRKNPAVKSRLDAYRATLPKELPEAAIQDVLQGGDKDSGRKIFYERQDVACFRCHQINGEGGEVGPALTGIASKQKREYLLEAILFPNRQIAAGFENVMITLHDDRDYAGLVKSETATDLVLNSPEDGLLTLKKSDIKSRQKGLSAMPEEMGKTLSPRDLRNLVEFLSSLK